VGGSFDAEAQAKLFASLNELTEKVAAIGGIDLKLTQISERLASLESRGV